MSHSFVSLNSGFLIKKLQNSFVSLNCDFFLRKNNKNHLFVSLNFKFFTQKITRSLRSLVSFQRGNNFYTIDLKINNVTLFFCATFGRLFCNNSWQNCNNSCITKGFLVQILTTYVIQLQMPETVRAFWSFKA